MLKSARAEEEEIYGVATAAAGEKAIDWSALTDSRDGEEDKQWISRRKSKGSKTGLGWGHHREPHATIFKCVWVRYHRQ